MHLNRVRGLDLSSNACVCMACVHGVKVIIGLAGRGRVITRVELSRESTCLICRVVTRGELSRRSSFSWVELSQGSSCHEGRVVR